MNWGQSQLQHCLSLTSDASENGVCWAQKREDGLKIGSLDLYISTGSKATYKQEISSCCLSYYEMSVSFLQTPSAFRVLFFSSNKQPIKNATIFLATDIHPLEIQLWWAFLVLFLLKPIPEGQNWWRYWALFFFEAEYKNDKKHIVWRFMLKVCYDHTIETLATPRDATKNASNSKVICCKSCWFLSQCFA